jgi:hypothetical protein
MRCGMAVYKKNVRLNTIANVSLPTLIYVSKSIHNSLNMLNRGACKAIQTELDTLDPFKKLAISNLKSRLVNQPSISKYPARKTKCLKFQKIKS